MAYVLIIDDEKSIRSTLSSLLKVQGHDVREAEDAEVA
jgi:CheY-like chemotaxis protein